MSVVWFKYYKTSYKIICVYYVYKIYFFADDIVETTETHFDKMTNHTDQDSLAGFLNLFSQLGGIFLQVDKVLNAANSNDTIDP